MYLTAQERFLFFLLSVVLGMMLIAFAATMTMTSDLLITDGKLIIIDNSSYQCKMINTLKGDK